MEERLALTLLPCCFLCLEWHQSVGPFSKLRGPSSSLLIFELFPCTLTFPFQSSTQTAQDCDFTSEPVHVVGRAPLSTSASGGHATFYRTLYRKQVYSGKSESSQ